MTTTDTDLSHLIIHMLTKNEYDNETISNDDLYFLTDVNPDYAIKTLSGTSITLTDNSINTLTLSGNTTFTLPTVSNTAIFHQILVQVNMPTAYTIILGTSTYFGGSAPDLSNTGNYNLIYEYDNALQAWVVGCVSKGA